MELGEKLRQERLALGLSQREVCGDQITRNMLSRIEHGQVTPSMKTLRYLASALQRPVGYFLGEATPCVNQRVMDGAKESFAQGKYAKTLLLLGDYRAPDPLYDWEMGMLGYLSCLEAARIAMGEGRLPVAGKLLGQAKQFQSPYITDALTQLREELLSSLENGQGKACSLDEALLLQARRAVEDRGYERAERLLEAVEHRDKNWYLLRGTLELRRGSYAQAEKLLLLAEEEPALPLLEECYRAQGDFERAYYCAQRRLEKGRG